MKKKGLFFVALAALTMATSCSHDEQQSVNNGRAISFNAALDVTRANDFDTDNLDAFWATAIGNSGTYFAEKFTKQGSSWESARKYFWPDYELKFYAYAPEAKSNGFTVANNTTIKDFTVKDKATNQVDLIVGYASGDKTTYPDGGVPLTLTHALSKVKLQVKGTNTGYKCVIKNVFFGNLQNSGAFDIAKKEWSNQTGKASYKQTLANTITVDGTQNTKVLTVDGSFKLLPQSLVEWDRNSEEIAKTTSPYIGMLVKITTVAGASVHDGPIYVPVKAKTWEPNTEYTYTIDFSDGFGYSEKGKPIIDSSKPIRFVNVEVSKWTEETVDDIKGGEKAD